MDRSAGRACFLLLWKCPHCFVDCNNAPILRAWTALWPSHLADTWTPCKGSRQGEGLLGMSQLGSRGSGTVPRRTLEVDFPAPLNSDEVITLPGPNNAPIVKQAVRWKTTPLGRDMQSQVWYTGLTNGNNREAYNRWHDWNKRRELKSVPHAYAQHMREACWYDPKIPAQYLHPGTRWGPFEWNDKPIPRKEFVVNRHTFGTQPGQTEECLHPYIPKF